MRSVLFPQVGHSYRVTFRLNGDPHSETVKRLTVKELVVHENYGSAMRVVAWDGTEAIIPVRDILEISR